MIDTSHFAKLRMQHEQAEGQREALIAKSREVVHTSKLLIYAVHRNDEGATVQHRKSLDRLLNDLRNIIKGRAELDASGSTRIAMQEYVEAVCFQEYSATGKIPTAETLQVDVEQYLLGLCDLCGELVRKAVHAAIAGDVKAAKHIRDSVEALYGEFLQFNFRNGDVRRKFDGIKYDLKKLEDLVLDLTLKR